MDRRTDGRTDGRCCYHHHHLLIRWTVERREGIGRKGQVALLYFPAGGNLLSRFITFTVFPFSLLLLLLLLLKEKEEDQQQQQQNGNRKRLTRFNHHQARGPPSFLCGCTFVSWADWFQVGWRRHFVVSKLRLFTSTFRRYPSVRPSDRQSMTTTVSLALAIGISFSLFMACVRFLFYLFFIPLEQPVETLFSCTASLKLRQRRNLWFKQKEKKSARVTFEWTPPLMLAAVANKQKGAIRRLTTSPTSLFQ